MPTNYLLHSMKFKSNNLCRFCHQYMETTYLFAECLYSMELWRKLQSCLIEHAFLPASLSFSKQEMIFGGPMDSDLVNNMTLAAKNIYFGKI